MTVAGCTGANGFCIRMLLGTPCEAQSAAVAPVTSTTGNALVLFL